MTHYFVMRLLILVVALLLSAVGAFWFGAGDLWWWNLCFTGFAAGKLTLCNLMPQGHGINGTRHVMGMPFALLIPYFLILAIVVMLGMSDMGTLGPETVANLHSLAAAAFLGWLAGLLEWYLVFYWMTYYASEYQERVQLKARGHSDEQIEEMITRARRRGVYGPQK